MTSSPMLKVHLSRGEISMTTYSILRTCATKLHRGKTLALLFKLDICKAFDSIHWDFLLDLLQRRFSLAIFAIGLPPYSPRILHRSSLMGLLASLFCMVGVCAKETHYPRCFLFLPSTHLCKFLRMLLLVGSFTSFVGGPPSFAFPYMRMTPQFLLLLSKKTFII
jgi:hypothetical protein